MGEYSGALSIGEGLVGGARKELSSDNLLDTRPPAAPPSSSSLSGLSGDEVSASVSISASASVSTSASALLSQPPLSDEDRPLSNPQGGAEVEERRHRRMLSNRESARRSRLRKQQHLDELRGQVARLRSENAQMSSECDLASHHYNQIAQENQALRAEARDLSYQLQHLYHTVAGHCSSSDAQQQQLQHLHRSSDHPVPDPEPDPATGK